MQGGGSLRIGAIKIGVTICQSLEAGLHPLLLAFPGPVKPKTLVVAANNATSWSRPPAFLPYFIHLCLRGRPDPGKSPKVCLDLISSTRGRPDLSIDEQVAPAL